MENFEGTLFFSDKFQYSIWFGNLICQKCVLTQHKADFRYSTIDLYLFSESADFIANLTTPGKASTFFECFSFGWDNYDTMIDQPGCVDPQIVRTQRWQDCSQANPIALNFYTRLTLLFLTKSIDFSVSIHFLHCLNSNWQPKIWTNYKMNSCSNCCKDALFILMLTWLSEICRFCSYWHKNTSNWGTQLIKIHPNSGTYFPKYKLFQV
jgi:hypothetical protein